MLNKQIRSVYRTVEFGVGTNGYPFQHEWMLYVFEAVPVWIAMFVLGWWHPVTLLQPKSNPDCVVGSNGSNKVEGTSAV
jgi:RTA1 like protein